MKLHTRLGAVLALLLLPLFTVVPAIAQTKSGPLTITSTGCVTVSVDGQAQIAINVSGGSWSGTIQPKASIAGQAVANVQVTPSTSSTAQSTITANGLYTATVAGYQQFWLCGNTVTGTATIFTVTTTRSASGRNGSGGGAPSGAAGGDLNGTYPNPGVVNINGTAFSGTNGHLVSFGAANIPADSGVVAANAVTAAANLTNGQPVLGNGSKGLASGAINLAGGASFVTGVLPAANIADKMWLGGYFSVTPAATQHFPPNYRGTISTAVNSAMVVPNAITVTGISASVSAAEGAAATIAFTLETCTTASCGATSTTAVTCTIGNSSNTCSQTGQAVAISAGALIAIQSVQTGTGTAQVGSVSLTYQ